MVLKKNKPSLDILDVADFLNYDSILSVFTQNPWHSKLFFDSKLQFCMLSPNHIYIALPKAKIINILENPTWT